MAQGESPRSPLAFASVLYPGRSLASQTTGSGGERAVESQNHSPVPFLLEPCPTPCHHKGAPIGEWLSDPGRQELAWPGEWACARRAGSTLWRTLRRTLQRTLDARSGTRSDASSGTRSGTRIGLGLLRGNLTSAAAPTGAGGLAGHGPVLSSKQLGRLGGGLPAVLGRVFLCCRQPALKVSQLALEVLLLALKVLYERLKVWGRGATRARHPPPRP